MKRVLAWILVLTLCLGLFAGCKKNKTETPNNGDVVTSTADLDAALEYIKTVYKKVGEKTPKDFQRIGNVPVNGKNYEVVWSANVGEEFVKVVKGNDGMVTIDVNEKVDKEVKYVLTATISDDVGNSVSHGWNHLIPVAGNMASIVEEAYLLEPGASMGYEVTLTGKITAVNTPWDAGFKNITVTIIVEGAEDKPIMCYRLAGEGADKLKPNDIITVTGTIKNYNGTIEFDAGCTLDAYIEGEEIKSPTDAKQIIKEAYELAEGGALPYKATLTGKITKVDTEYNPGYKNVTVTMVVDGDTQHPIQCYRLAGDGADKIGEGDTITVTGWLTNYKGKVQFGQGCTLDSWKDTGANVPKPEDTFTTTLVPEIVTEPQAGVAYKFFLEQKNLDKNLYMTGEMDGYYYQTTYDPEKAADVYLEEVSGGWRAYFMKGGVKTYLEMAVNGTHKNVIFTTSPSKALKWNDEVDTITCDLLFEGETKDYYWGTWSFYKTFSASDVARVTGSDANLTDNFVGHFATMKETAVEEKSAAEQAFEALKEEYFVESTDPTVTAENYTRKNVYDVEGTKVNVTWTADNDAVTIVDNGDGTVTVQVVRGEEDIPYNLTATIVDGTNTYEKSWECKIPALPKTSAKDILDAAYALEDGQSLADAATLTGIVVEINSAYSEQYGNITVTVVVEDMFDKPVQCFRLAGEGAKDIAVFDYITVTGILKNYRGTIEFDQGCTLDARKTQAQIVDEVYALEKGAALSENYMLVGVVTSIDTPYSEQYGNITVTMAVPGCEEKPIQCYRLAGAGADQLQVGYTIAVYGSLKNYNGTYEFDKGCALIDYVAPSETQLTFKEIVEAAYALESGASLEDTYTLAGVITKVNNEYSAQYGNVTVTIVVEDMMDKPIMCYRLAGDGADAIAVGDTIVVTGKIKNYNGTIEFDQGCVLEEYATPAQIVDEAYALETNDSLALGFTLTGEIISVDTPYSAQYGNVTVTMAVAGKEDKPIKCYRLAGEGADVIAVGDTITVHGILTNYNGNIQYKQGTVLLAYTKATAEPSVAEQAFAQLKTDYPATTTVQSTSDNYDCKNVYEVGEETVNVVWSDNSDSVAIRENGNGTITVVVTRGAADAPYTLTATIDHGGEQYSTSWECVVPAVASDPEPTTPTYTKITSMDQLVTGQYVIVAGNGYAPTTISSGSSPWVLATQPVIEGDVVTDAKEAVWTITVDGASAKLTDANGTSIKPKAGNNNGIQAGDYDWAVTFANGTFRFAGTGSDTTILASNNTAQYEYKFRSYKTSTINGNAAGYPCDFTLYKLDETQSGGGQEQEPVVAYNKITNLDELVTGQYVMIAGNGYAPTTISSGSSPWVLSVQPVVEGNVVTDTKDAVWTITVNGSSVKLTDANGATIKPKAGNNNGIQAGDYDWAVTFANGTFRFAGVGSDTTILACNNTAQYEYKFRSYKTSTINGNATGYPCDFTLYKLGTSSSGGQGSGSQGGGSQGGGSQDPGATTPPITDVVYTYGSTTAYSNVIKNWGRRGFNATFLSPNAVSFYEDNDVTYEELAALAGTSNALYVELQELMETNHTELTNYGDTRYLYAFTDCQDQDENTLTCFYSGNKIGPAWDSGATWNREHCWPKSKTDTPDVNNNTTGECGDLMTLRPVTSNINSSRSNKAYGTGADYYNPNSSAGTTYDLRGDVARIVLYTYVRWENSNIWGTSGVIESMDVLLEWMEADPVDTWEMGRNDSVESVTGTRNVFVDYPELAFLLFGENVPTMVTPSGKAAA